MIDFDKVYGIEGQTIREKAEGLAMALAESEDFLLYVYWRECVNKELLWDCESDIEKYFISLKWQEYRSQYHRQH